MKIIGTASHFKKMAATKPIASKINFGRLFLMALKFKDFSIKNNLPKFILIGIGIIAIIFLKWLAVPTIFIAYIILSLAFKNKTTTMALGKIFSFLVPKDKNFFKLFAQASDNLVEISKVFSEMANAPRERRQELLKKIGDLEHVGDELTHQIFIELSTNFITPFDREDISYLASSLDDIVDYIDGSAKRNSINR